MEKFENLLAYIIANWDGAHLIMEDFNIDLLDYHSTRTVQYKNMLSYFNLHRHVKQPTCVKDKYTY